MDRLTTTEITSLLDVSPQRINILCQQAEIQESDIGRKGLKKVFAPEATKSLFRKRGVNYNDKKIIAFCNNKGGVGKTSMAVNVSSMLSIMGMKVLVVDNDPQGNASSYLFRGGEKTKQFSLYDVVTGKVKIQDAIQKIDDHMDLLPSNLNNNHLERHFQTQNLNAMTYYKKLFSELDYNFIVWDLSPALSTSNTYAQMSCDDILIVTDLTDFGYQGVEMTINSILQTREQFDNWSPNIEILVNQFDERKVKTLEYIPKLQELAPINPIIIKTDNAVPVAQMQKQPIPQKSKAYKEIMQLVSRMIGLTSDSQTVQ